MCSTAIELEGPSALGSGSGFHLGNLIVNNLIVCLNSDMSSFLNAHVFHPDSEHPMD